MSDDAIMFVVEAVAMVAEHGWKLLPQVIVGSVSHEDHVIIKTLPITVHY